VFRYNGQSKARVVCDGVESQHNSLTEATDHALGLIVEKGLLGWTMEKPASAWSENPWGCLKPKQLCSLKSE
jgi:hypothetical protein